jgi:hypothetical protein
MESIATQRFRLFGTSIAIRIRFFSIQPPHVVENPAVLEIEGQRQAAVQLPRESQSLPGCNFQ